MGTWKFDRDKAWRAVAHPAFLELADALAEATIGDNRDKAITVTITGAKSTTLTLSPDNIAEVLEILRLTIGED